jgi:hypothetical protein
MLLRAPVPLFAVERSNPLIGRETEQKLRMSDCKREFCERFSRQAIQRTPTNAQNRRLAWKSVAWRAMADEDGQYCFAVAL